MDRFLDWIGYQLLMLLPYWIGCNADTRFGRWCLVRAGGHAYRDNITHDAMPGATERKAAAE